MQSHLFQSGSNVRFFYQDDPASISLALPVYEIVSSDESILEVSFPLQLFKKL